jgi:Tol biopolymer transport system component
MGAEPPDTPQSVRPPEDRLDSWKEIAAYLGRDVTTVQRWEKREGMPVHRHLHHRLGSVYAYRTELDAWTHGRNPPATPEPGGAVGAPAPASPAAASDRTTARSRAWSRVILPLLAAGVALAVTAGLWLRRTERFWRNPIADARFETIAELDGTQPAAVSRDGRLVGFLSSRDGPMDVWVTQVGSGQLHNLTRGSAPELGNPSVRNLAFSPDGALLTFWARTRGGSNVGSISIWAVPTLGGRPRPFLDGAAELDWSRDGSRIAYHTAGPGDPLFVSEGVQRTEDRPLHTAPAGLHAHFPLWAPDSTFIYFVQGSLPAAMDIWRVPASGGAAERITSHNGSVSHPVFLDRRTLVYLAGDAEGTGPWPYAVDVERRIPHRLVSGPQRYTSLAASADGHRLVATLASPRRTLWRLALDGAAEGAAQPVPIALTTSTGFSPRLGPGYVLYVSAAGSGESLWKLANGSSAEVWRGEGARVLGGPAVAPDGRRVALSVRQRGRTFLYVMQEDGSSSRVVTDSLDLQGAPAWTPDGAAITSAASDRGVPCLVRVPVQGGPPLVLARSYALDPVWTPDGRSVLYSGPDIGATFTVNAIAVEAATRPFPPLKLPRGSRHLTFLPDGRTLVVLEGGVRHKDLYGVDLETGVERPLARLPQDFEILDFDLSPDGRQAVVERTEERTEVVLLDLARP